MTRPTTSRGGRVIECLLQEHAFYVVGAVGDARERIVREVAPLFDEEVFHACERGVGQIFVKSIVPFPTSV